MDKKKIFIGLGILAAAGIGFYFWNKSKKSNKDVQTSSEKDIDVINKESVKASNSPTTIAESENPNTYRMGYISLRPSGYHAVMLVNRPPSGTIKVSDNVKITGTSFDGTYKVQHLFIDDSNRVGAIYIPINYTPTGKIDKTFENKGLVELI